MINPRLINAACIVILIQGILSLLVLVGSVALGVIGVAFGG